jgi:hypothetical protein
MERDAQHKRSKQRHCQQPATGNSQAASSRQFPALRAIETSMAEMAISLLEAGRMPAHKLSYLARFAVNSAGGRSPTVRVNLMESPLMVPL